MVRNDQTPTVAELSRAMRTLRHIKHPARMVASDLTPSERHLLQSISWLSAERDHVRPSDLAQKSRIRPSAVSPTLAALEDRGLVERQGDPQDRRVVRIVLTDEGRATAERVRAAVDEQLAGLADHLGEKDSLEFARLVGLVADYFVDVNGDPKAKRTDA